MKSRFSISFIACAALAASACGNGTPGQAEAASSVKLQGAGASFPAPLYNKWFKAYGAAHQNVQVDYQSVGSGGGVKSVIDHTVDFGASDAAMKPRGHGQGRRRRAALSDDRRQHRARLQPARASTPLKLSRKAYAGIFLGKVKRWNDPLDRRRPIPGRSCPICRSTSSSAPTAAAPRSSSPSI